MTALYFWTKIFYFFSLNWVSSHFRVLRISFSPTPLWNPGFFEHQINPNMTDRQLMWLAHLITATPGTLSVDIEGERDTLLIHLLESNQQSQEDLSQLVAQYERNLMHDE